MRRKFGKCVAITVLLMMGGLPAASAEQILLESGQVKITSLDFEAEVERIPAEDREAFLTSKARISKLLENMLIYKTQAAQARKAGIDTEPLMKKRLELAAEKLLSKEHADRAAAALKLPDFEPRARELYKIDADKYTLSEKVHVSHILVDSKKRSADEALKRIQEVRAKALDGKPFEALAQEYSDDPSVKENKGDLGFFEAGRMVKPFSDAAFAMDKPGEISEPVKTKYGYHIILFHEKQAKVLRPFDEVKEEIVKTLRGKYISEFRAEQLAKITTDPSLKLHQEEVDKYWVDPDAIMKQREAGAAK